MTAKPKPSAEAQRRAEIKQRRETSAFWMAVHLLGSLNLAVILLITIAGAIAFATIMESKFDTAVARYYIYDAVWFNFWLLAWRSICSAPRSPAGRGSASISASSSPTRASS